jgi:HD-GYP domain-containing protein (c-di-GMP phosphodiesterase class II)
MSTSTLNPSVQKELNKVQNTLHEITCLSNLYNSLFSPRQSGRFGSVSDNVNEFNLGRIKQALTTMLDLEKLFPLVNDLAVSGTNSSSGIIVSVNKKNVQLKASRGLASQIVNGMVFMVGEGAIGLAVKSGETVTVDDIDQDPRFVNQQYNWYHGKTLICVPIKIGNRVVGAINVINKKTGQLYDANDVRFVETIASYIAIAIKNSDSSDGLNGTNKLDHFTSMYYDESTRYLPVSLRSIKAGAFAGCDLYLQTVVNSEIKYVLYCKGDKLFDDERKESFVKKNINRMFVAKNGRTQYMRYMENNLEQVMHDEMTPLQKRMQFAYDIAVNIVTDSLNRYRGFINIERARDWVTVMLNFILSDADKSVFTQMMKVLVYDGDIYKHSVNTAIMGLLFGHYLSIPANELLTIGTGLLLHDIGKTGMDPQIKEKDFSKLSREEKEQLTKHPELGYMLLSNSGNLPRDGCLIAKQHHEQYNGKGYPEGLKNEDIHYYSRIAHILDEFETQMSHYSMDSETSVFLGLQKMVRQMDGSFDKELLKEFISFVHDSSSEDEM